jgi:hypothetical protein
MPPFLRWLEVEGRTDIFQREPFELERIARGLALGFDGSGCRVSIDTGFCVIPPLNRLGRVGVHAC